MDNGHEVEWWRHYLVDPTEPHQKPTWTALLGLYRYMLREYRSYVRRTVAKHNQVLRNKK